MEEVSCCRSLFFTAAHFHLALVAASISHFVTAATQNSSLLTLLLSLLYKTPVAMRFPAKITSSCIWVAILVD